MLMDIFTQLIIVFFSFQMKPREAFSILATALLIGTVIAQDQLFECPRGKENVSIFCCTAVWT